MARSVEYKFNTTDINIRIRKIKEDHNRLMKDIKLRMEKSKKLHKLSMQRIADKFISKPKTILSRKKRHVTRNRV